MSDNQYVRDNQHVRDNLMIIAAFRYCLGRMTYIVSDCAEWVIANWDDWPESVKKIIRNDLEEAFKRDDEARLDGKENKPLGLDYDRNQWERVRNLWK